MPRGGRMARGKVPAAGVASSKGDKQVTCPALPVTATQLPVTRCRLCPRTVAYKPGNLSEVLTGHYRRAQPEAPGLPSR